MTRPYQTLILLVTSIFFLSLVHAAQPKEAAKFFVQGQVYCDTCRAQFITKSSTYMKGATVRLECRNREQDTNLTFSVEGQTDDTGTYHLPVDGDHEDDMCEIKLVKSPDPQCSEVSTEKFSKDVAKVSLTTNSGMSSDVRLANPIGFMKKEPQPECKQLMEELGVLPDN